MSDSPPPNPIDPVITPPPRKSCGRKRFFCFLFPFALVIAAAIALHYCPWFMHMHGGSADLAPVKAELATAEARVQALEARVDELSAHTPPATTASAESGKSSADVAKLQSDLASLTAALSAMQTQVKQSGDAREDVRNLMGAAIAFIQLRDAAQSGRPFVNELSAMRVAAGNDHALLDAAAKLEPFAAKGAPPVSALRDLLQNSETSAANAVDRAQAQGLWQRILAELKSLVSIRPLHGTGPQDSFGAMEEALTRGDVDAALDLCAALPPEAQESLADWKQQAQARRETDAALGALAAHFTQQPVAP